MLNFAHFMILVGIYFGYPIGAQRRKVIFNETVDEVENDTNYSTASSEISEPL